MIISVAYVCDRTQASCSDLDPTSVIRIVTTQKILGALSDYHIYEEIKLTKWVRYNNK